jgi:hypothetical protein
MAEKNTATAVVKEKEAEKSDEKKKSATRRKYGGMFGLGKKDPPKTDAKSSAPVKKISLTK